MRTFQTKSGVPQGFIIGPILFILLVIMQNLITVMKKTYCLTATHYYLSEKDKIFSGVHCVYQSFLRKCFDVKAFKNDLLYV
jgi:hypothetical protein